MPFDTGAEVLATYYLGADVGTNPNPYTSYFFDITALVGGGGIFDIRFAETDNLSFFNLGVDNVSIEVVPEPTTIALLGIGLAGLAGAEVRRRRKKKAVDKI